MVRRSLIALAACAAAAVAIALAAAPGAHHGGARAARSAKADPALSAAVSRVDPQPCSVSGSSCVRGCTVPVAVRPQSRGATAPCASATRAAPCLEPVAAGGRGYCTAPLVRRVYAPAHKPRRR